MAFLRIAHLAFFLPADSEFSMENHRAGSAGDQAVANKIQRKFKQYGLTTWADEHFVKVRKPRRLATTSSLSKMQVRSVHVHSCRTAPVRV